MGECAAKKTPCTDFAGYLRKDKDMEFNLSTDIQQSIPQAIVFNYDELKTELTEKIKPYEAMAVTKEDLKGAASNKAALNKLKKALNDKRIEVKKAYIAPFETFENQIKELMGIIDGGIVNIDKQLKEFEQKRINEKYAEIESFYKEEIGEYEDLLPLDRILPDKWKNKGSKTAVIQTEIHDCVFKFKNDIRIIKAMDLECENQVLNSYIRSLDMSVALEEKHKYEEQQALLKRVSEKEIKKEPEAPPETPQEPTCASKTDEQTRTIDVRFYDTNSSFRKKMKELCELYNIKYSGVSKGE